VGTLPGAMEDAESGDVGVSGLPQSEAPTRWTASRSAHLDAMPAVVVVIATAIALTAVTLLMLALDAPFAVRSPELDLAIAASTAFAALGVASMAWIRYREAGPRLVLCQTSAFLALAVGGFLFVLSDIIDLPVQPEAGAWGRSVNMTVAALLLSIGVVAALRRTAPTRFSPYLLVLLPLVVVCTVSLLGPAIVDRLPSLLDPHTDAVANAAVGTLMPRLQPMVLLVEAPSIVLFTVAAAGYLLLHVRDRQPGFALSAVGLVFAVASQVHFALLPVNVHSIFTTADVLRSTFFITVLLAAVQASRADLRSLRLAYDDRLRVQESEVRRAALEERSRLAREIHDKLTQSLWLARLRQGQLLELELSPEARRLAETVVHGLDTGLTESREATLALSVGPDGPMLIDRIAREAVARAADDLELDVSFASLGAFPPLQPVVEAEILAITREALFNVAKHADAALVRVDLASDADGLTLTVTDNGSGFDPTGPPPGHGLWSMRERASRIGARLTVDSRPMDGTRVSLRLPYDQPGVEA
jgi:signal transduction histidine kinase